MRADRPPTNPCAAGWTGTSRGSRADPPLQRLQARFRCLEHTWRTGGARKLRVAVVAQPLVAGHPFEPADVGEPLQRAHFQTQEDGQVADRVDPGDRPAREPHPGVEERFAQDARDAWRPRQLVEDDRHVGGQLARAVERWPVIGLQDLRRDPPQPRATAHGSPAAPGQRVELPLAAEERGGQHAAEFAVAEH